jgi:hypothetical protein
MEQSSKQLYIFQSSAVDRAAIQVIDNRSARQYVEIETLFCQARTQCAADETGSPEQKDASGADVCHEALSSR